MRIAYEAFWLAKAGYAEDEYEDACASTDAGDPELSGDFRCAVADGATETSFSGLWARILVEAFVNGQIADVTPQSVAPLAGAWRSLIDERTRDKPLPWYAQEKLQQGAFSSLMGLTLRDDGTWSALCVGDSCLFHVRPHEAIWASPYHLPEQFTNHPALISTNANANGGVRVHTVRGSWQDGDLFLLMTDALAHFFLSQRFLRSQLVGATSAAAFERIVANARSEQLCRNDDVTFVKAAPSGLPVATR